jgi:hypothetical protein
MFPTQLALVPHPFSLIGNRHSLRCLFFDLTGIFDEFTSVFIECHDCPERSLTAPAGEKGRPAKTPCFHHVQAI